MVEFLYDCIKAIPGEDINICAEITEADYVAALAELGVQ